jgi:hypothetical protein
MMPFFLIVPAAFLSFLNWLNREIGTNMGSISLMQRLEIKSFLLKH